jgi:hypothetical protein
MTDPAQVCPELVYAHASPHSVGGISLFEADSPVRASNVTNFHSPEPLRQRAAQRLAAAGFTILHLSPVTINIAGPVALYERVFHTTVCAQERPVLKSGARASTATFLDSPDTEQRGLISTAGTDFADLLEGVALDEPRWPMALAASPPEVPYWHLSVPDALSTALRADTVHAQGVTGRGVSVVMTDTGHYSAHPYFQTHGYHIAPVVLAPGATESDQDASGHGTAQSANLLAVAPDCAFTMVKMSFVNAIGALHAAIARQPRIISCSWGSDVPQGPLSAADQALAAAVATAVASGIVVVASSGDGQRSLPGQCPDVLSAGGVFLHPDGALEASDYSSGFTSQVYPDRIVPDVCGLVGMRPRGVYLMLPTAPGGVLDHEVATLGGYPAGDETAADDGWVGLSGTSAAAPQLAGVLALLLQVNPALRPDQLIDVLRRTARRVQAGHSYQNVPAAPGPDGASGCGLVDAQAALDLVLDRARVSGEVRYA